MEPELDRGAFLIVDDQQVVACGLANAIRDHAHVEVVPTSGSASDFDAGVVDGADGGVGADAGAPTDGGGGGCSASRAGGSSGATGVLMLLAALALANRRRAFR